MVYRGKPSGGCQACRKKKIKCDQTPGGCKNCQKQGRECSGYRNQLDLLFLDESASVQARAKKRGQGAKGARSSSTTSASPSPQQDKGAWSKDAIETNTLQLVKQIHNTHEEMAIAYFFKNFDVACDGNGETPAPKFTISMDNIQDHLYDSMLALGMAGLCQKSHAPAMQKDAMKHYISALRGTNHALSVKELARKDSTLIAVVMLGTYELWTCRGQRAMRAWTNHVNGAASLLKLRGSSQFHTLHGRRLFVQAAVGISINCNWLNKKIPQQIHQLIEECDKYTGVRILDPAWNHFKVMMKWSDFWAECNQNAHPDPADRLRRALVLEEQMMAPFQNLSSLWRYETYHSLKDRHLIFDGHFHIYSSFVVFSTWSGMRTIRLMCSEIILHALQALREKTASPDTVADIDSQFKGRIKIMQQLQADVIASVPQQFAISFGAELESPPRRPDGSLIDLKRFHENLWSSWHGMNDLGPSSGTYRMAVEEALAILKHHDGWNFMWPLYIAGRMSYSTPEASMFCINKLRYLQAYLGSQQAATLADDIEDRRGLKLPRPPETWIEEIEVQQGELLTSNIPLEESVYSDCSSEAFYQDDFYGRSTTAATIIQ